MNIPEGFVLVPSEATKDMVKAYINANGDLYDAWAAMISAAPPVELPAYDEAKERELFEAENPLEEGIEWREDRQMYCVYICGSKEGWNCVNSAFHAQRDWAVWNKCAKSKFKGRDHAQ